ncbi:MAG: hypothetical protein L6R40_006320 [Gallowayella cf. fulva]|nr:MAG: hypothetical protein L6R40_006320 [Xanthomendoza cf. fulva]
MSSPKANESDNTAQLSPLPAVHRHITGHNADGLAVFHSSTPAAWSTWTPSLAFNVVYTTSDPMPSMNNDVDIDTHESVTASGKLGLVNPTGSVCRMVDFGPSTDDEHSKQLMHRTQSLDYGIVLEGEIECVLDSGATRLMKRGDIAVQRGTMHAWRNASNTDWARMIFVLLAAEKVNVQGKELSMDMGDVPEALKQRLEGEL